MSDTLTIAVRESRMNAVSLFDKDHKLIAPAQFMFRAEFPGDLVEAEARLALTGHLWGFTPVGEGQPHAATAQEVTFGFRGTLDDVLAELAKIVDGHRMVATCELAADYKAGASTEGAQERLARLATAADVQPQNVIASHVIGAADIQHDFPGWGIQKCQAWLNEHADEISWKMLETGVSTVGDLHDDVERDGSHELNSLAEAIVADVPYGETGNRAEYARVHAAINEAADAAELAGEDAAALAARLEVIRTKMAEARATTAA